MGRLAGQAHQAEDSLPGRGDSRSKCLEELKGSQASFGLEHRMQGWGAVGSGAGQQRGQQNIGQSEGA